MRLRLQEPPSFPPASPPRPGPPRRAAEGVEENGRGLRSPPVTLYTVAWQGEKEMEWLARNSIGEGFHRKHSMFFAPWPSAIKPRPSSKEGPSQQSSTDPLHRCLIPPSISYHTCSPVAGEGSNRPVASALLTSATGEPGRSACGVVPHPSPSGSWACKDRSRGDRGEVSEGQVPRTITIWS